MRAWTSHARAARYARERIVFNRPIGMNQGIQHPLARCWAQLEAANLMVMKAAIRLDRGPQCGVEANVLLMPEAHVARQE